MTEASLQDRIGNIFARDLHIEVPDPDRDLIETGTIDSLTFVDLIAHLEEEFSIQIPLDDVDLDHFRSIVQIGQFIESRLPESEVPHGSYSRV
jgi:methoxymalonate biosynthesis acyl carrier protein